MEVSLSCSRWATSAMALHGMGELPCVLTQPLMLWFDHLQRQS